MLRALIERTQYVDEQIPHAGNDTAIELMREVILIFERRAAERHGFTFGYDRGIDGPVERHAPDYNGHLTQFWKRP